MVSMEFFIDESFRRPMALESTQPLTEMSTRNISLVDGERQTRLVRRADNLPPSFADCLEMWVLNFLETSRSIQASTGIKSAIGRYKSTHELLNNYVMLYETVSLKRILFRNCLRIFCFSINWLNWTSSNSCSTCFTVSISNERSFTSGITIQAIGYWKKLLQNFTPNSLQNFLRDHYEY